MADMGGVKTTEMVRLAWIFAEAAVTVEKDKHHRDRFNVFLNGELLSQNTEFDGAAKWAERVRAAYADSLLRSWPLLVANMIRTIPDMPEANVRAVTGFLFDVIDGHPGAVDILIAVSEKLNV